MGKLFRRHLPLPRNMVQPLGEENSKHYFQYARSDQYFHARVAELADAQDLKSCVLTDVRVQVPPRVLEKTRGLLTLQQIPFSF